MPKIIKAAKSVSDFTTDSIDKISSPASRAGSTVERVGKMRKANVHSEVIALQMTKNSAKKQAYEVRDIEAFEKLYNDTQTKVGITAKQARTLIEAQQQDEHTIVMTNKKPDTYSGKISKKSCLNSTLD
jgi:peptidyl-tRNA hydrolase